MQVQGGLAAEEVILGSERRFLLELKVDWNQNGLFNHPLSDLGSYADNITTDRALKGSAPEEILLVEGSSAAELSFTVSGEYEGMPLTAVFSPYNKRSPLYGKQIVNSEIKYRLGVETPLGVFWYSQFVGNVRTATPRRGDNAVEITAADRAEKLRKSIQLPAWAVTEEQLNWGEEDAMLCRSHWVIDNCLRLCDVGAGPKRPTFRHEVTGFLRDREGPQFFATLNGSTVPTLGHSENMWASSFPSAGTAMYTDTGPLHPAAPAGSPRPQAVASLGLPIGQVRGNPNDRGILRWWVAERDLINAQATHYFGFTINTNGPNNLRYQTIALHNAMEIRVGNKFEVRIQVQTGQVRTQWFNENTNQTFSGPWINIPANRSSVDVFAMWDFTLDTGSRCYIETDEAITTGWVTVASPPAAGAADVVGGRVTVGTALSLSDVFYAARSYYGSDVRKFEAWMPVKYPAVLDRGLNRFTHMPSAKPQEAWKIITDVAGAEMGSVFWDEDGVFRFWNLATVLNKQKTVVRKFSLDKLSDLNITNSLDSVRNEYSVQTTKKRGVGIVNVYKSSEVNEFYVPARTTKTFQLWVDDVASPWTQVMQKYSSDPLSGGAYPWGKWDDKVVHGYCVQYLISNLWQEVNSRTGVDINVFFSRDGFLTIKIWNGWEVPIRLANGAGDSSNAAFALGGTKIVEGSEQTLYSRGEDSIRIYDARNLELSGDWYQDSKEGLDLIDSLRRRTEQPIPATDAIEIPGDPRLQLGDTVQIQDPNGFGEDIYLQILGIQRSYSKDFGLKDVLTVEMIQPGTVIVDPGSDNDDGIDPGSGTDPNRVLRTNLLPNPQAISSLNAVGEWAASAGSGYVTSQTGMVNTTGYRMVAGANDGRLPFGAVQAGKTYRFSAFVKADGANRSGTVYIKWISATDTTIANGPQTPWSVTSGQVIRVDSQAQVAPVGAVKARLYIKLDGPIVVTGGLYEQTSDLKTYFDSTTANAWLNEDNTASIDVTPAGGGSSGGTGDPTYANPGTCLNIGSGGGRNHFNVGIGLPTHTDYPQSTIASGFTSAFYFELTPDKAWTSFRVYMNGGRTSSGTSYPRSELRELDQNGTSLAAWNGGSGMHYIEGESRIMHLPPVKPWVCFFQVHDASSDLARVQTEVTSGKLGIVCRNTPPGGSEIKKVIMTEYTVGTPVKWRMEINAGNGKVFLNGTQVQTFAGNQTGCYYKMGAYAQSNQTIDAASEYVHVDLRNLVQWHTGWPTPLPAVSNGTTNPQPGGGGSNGSGDGTTAAGRYGWGNPLSSSDTFTYTGVPDPAKWDVYGKGGTVGGAQCWVGHDGNGRRCYNNAYVNGQYMRITGLANGDTTGISHKFGQHYGRWEVRARFLAKSGATGKKYHPVLIIWPDDDRWPESGEYDFVEVDIGDTGLTAYLHYPHPANVSVQQEFKTKSNVDITQWHNYGFEWTSSGLKGYIDGDEWFTLSGGGGPSGRSDIQAMPSGHLTIQLDNFFGASGMQEAYLDVLSANVYDLNGPGPSTGGGGTSGGAPGSRFDLTPWKITIPTDGPDAGTAADEIINPALKTYEDANFLLNGSKEMEMRAPVQGATTSGSGGTRTELREMQNGAEADWAFSSSPLRQLTVTGIFDPTSITDRKEMIVGQIHGETGTPPLYLAIEHHVASPRLRLFKNGPGLANLITGLTATSVITYRIRIENGRCKVWAALGGVGNLPTTPQYDFPASDFTDASHCYFKAGSYNKSEVQNGGTGTAIAKIQFLEMIQGNNVYTGSSGSTTGTGGGTTTPTGVQILQEKAFQITSTAENSTKNWWESYRYIEDIKDGRGYTGGIVGFTSATGDMLEMVQDYYAKKPSSNPLATWRQGLIDCANFGDTVDDAVYGVNGGGASTIANSKLGSAFRTAWANTADNDAIFRKCQRDYRERVYWTPAYNAAVADGLGPLGVAIYYDTSVNHGPGEPNSNDGSFDDIRSRTSGTKPKNGGNEKTWLTNFMNRRSAVLTEWGDNPSDGRVKTFKDLINTNNLTLTTPFSWSVYGDSFTMSTDPTPRTD